MFRNITPVVKNLLLINIAVFLVATFVFPSLDQWFALYNIQSTYFKPFQFLSYMFMHADFWHLFSNMFGLLIFGPLLEQFLGPKKLFILWMVSGMEQEYSTLAIPWCSTARWRRRFWHLKLIPIRSILTA